MRMTINLFYNFNLLVFGKLTSLLQCTGVPGDKLWQQDCDLRLYGEFRQADDQPEGGRMAMVDRRRGRDVLIIL